MADDPLHSFRPVPRTGVIYVMARAREQGFAYGHPEWSNLGQGAPETGPIPGGVPRLESVAMDVRTHEYGPVPGIDELRDAVAELYNHRYRRGMPTRYSAENVAISAGGRTGLTRLAAALGPVHLGHLLPDYTAYEELFEIFKAFVPMPIPLGHHEGFRLTAPRLREAIRGTGLGALLLSNPCNPTGQVLRGEELRAMVAVCSEHYCALIVDEFYSHYLYDGALDEGGSVSVARYVEDIEREPVVLVDGVTKNWRYPGLRLAWTVGPKEVIQRVSSAGSFLDGGASHPLQRAVLPLLAPELADQEARAIQSAFARKRRHMLRRIQAMGMRLHSMPGGAFYCFPSLSELPAPLNDGMRFFEAALEHKVICVPGEFFDVDPGQRRSHIPSRLASFVRLSFGPSMDEVSRGLDRLERMIASA